MKKFTYYLVAIALFSTQCHAWSWFGAEFKNEMTKQQNSTNKRLSDIKAGINDVQLKLGNISLSLQAQANATAKVQAGIDKSNTQSAGRDIISTENNSTELMLKIFEGVSALFLAMFAFMKARVNVLSKQNEYLTESRKKYQDRFLKLLSPEYEKLVDKENPES
ncbi:hypothetical protein FP828_03650 [bacterium]|nr:hypothetical protein [Candidatus Omnitrophota bacterium]MBA3065568.1 hypothetical protein [bacterium]